MAAFEIDDRKYRQAMPAPTSTMAEDLKWSGAFFGFWVAVIAWAGFVALSVLRALF